MMELRDLHWLMNLLTHMDVGIAVFDLSGEVLVWNSFMENHSGFSSTEIKDHTSLFDTFPTLKEPWIMGKMQSALMLDNEVFISWEQIPHLFDFAAYRPVTGGSEKMYQNITIKAIKDPNGSSNLVALMVYDVTDIAVNRLALQQANEELAKLSKTDPLTKLNNRGYWQEKLEEAVRLNTRYGTIYSLIMFDIDHFKKINDTYGHQAGDLVIKQVAAIARESARATDIVGRYGGEEFGIILPETDGRSGCILAERIRTGVEGSHVIYGEQQIKVTISLGICELAPPVGTETAWLEAADQALYSAKHGGRNQSKLAEFPDNPK